MAREKNYIYPTVLVFKTSNRSNARTKIKVINKNVDYVISAKKLPGIPEKAEWLEIGIGRSFIEQYKKKYNLAQSLYIYIKQKNNLLC